ncbi:MAG: uroporphyrinogen decarboxylase [Gammaproteobacteria bacterium]|jgi:uroporphyrinogen decarboxylase
MLKNDTFLRALRGQPTDYTPIWIMRQAGRYLPEYRKTREQAGDFLSLCKNPELACEVTLQPLRRFDLDAAILFSDILTIPDAMGLGLSLNEGVGPKFARPVRSAAEIAALGVPDPEQDLGYVMDAVRTIKSALQDSLPLIGFSGSPWTLATYMVEGGSSRDFKLIKSLIFSDPKAAHQLLSTVTESVITYLNAQIAAGVNVVQIFDTWGGSLGYRSYQEFSLQYMQRVVDGLNTGEGDDRIPVILFTKGGGQWLESMADTGCDALGLDWTTSLAEAKQRVGTKVCLQGNMDPMVLFSNPEAIVAEATAVLDDFGPAGQGHVFNLGHGILPGVSPDHVKVLVDRVHEYTRTS